MRQRPRVEIVQLPEAAVHALADGDLAAANAAAPAPLTGYFAGPDWRGLWRMRSTQLNQAPGDAGWITGVIWDVEQQLSVGRAGFHGPPDLTGMVEVGYAVDPAYRRRGYARAALERLLERAAHEPDVTTVRASIRPDNTASLALVKQYGFQLVSEQWDDEDGSETVLEVQASSTSGLTG